MPVQLLRPEIPRTRPLCIAHRGASGELPQNTLPAIERALGNDHADMVEFDVQVTRDGIPVVFHDDELKFLTNGSGKINDYTYAQLKQLDAGYHFDPEKNGSFPCRDRGFSIPLLDEVLSSFPQSAFLVEIKDKKPELIQKTLQLLKTRVRRAPLFIISLEEVTCRQIIRHLPGHAQNAFSPSDTFKAYVQFKLGIPLSPQYPKIASLPVSKWKIPLTTPAWIHFLHTNGIHVFYWTINDPEQMKTLLRNGADGIMTDFPGRLNEILNQTKSV
ncbi:MAG: glycerophosphodiester phosphodiesterase [Candidatus Omnitrophica bacterium]|nr:glycerophosphodiester phosphodiesterase [Candidatus Omnitrophota bacterium]